MHMYDLIEKKKRGGALSRAELDGLVAGAVSGDIPDYQLSAFLMAVYFQGMTAEETADFTLAMAHSGEMADLHDLPGESGQTLHRRRRGQDHAYRCAHCRRLRAGRRQNVGQGPGAYGRHGG